MGWCTAHVPFLNPKRTLVALTATQFFRIGYLAFASRPDCKRETNGISDARRKRGKTFLCIEAIRPIRAG
jgi:hypothetical protein